MGLPLLTINGVNIQMPTVHGWIPPNSLGIGGAGNEVISGIWKYGLEWDILFPDRFNEIWSIWYDNQGINITADLPEIGIATYTLKTYTCRIDPVIFRNYIEGVYQNIKTQLVGIDITI